MPASVLDPRACSSACSSRTSNLSSKLGAQYRLLDVNDVLLTFLCTLHRTKAAPHGIYSPGLPCRRSASWRRFAGGCWLSPHLGRLHCLLPTGHKSCVLARGRRQSPLCLLPIMKTSYALLSVVSLLVILDMAYALNFPVRGYTATSGRAELGRREKMFGVSALNNSGNVFYYTNVSVRPFVCG